MTKFGAAVAFPSSQGDQVVGFSFSKKYSLSLLALILLPLLFQNCAKTQFSSVELESTSEKQTLPTDENTDDLPPSSSLQNCSFNGRTINSGAEVTAYQNSTVTTGSACVKETRRCTNGHLSGSFNFAACTPGQPKMCLFNGQTIAHGATVKAFVTSTVGYGQTCKFENRVCSNGELSGSYPYSTCKVDGPMACLFNGKTIAHGDKVMAYQTSSAPYGQSCQSEIRSCSNGKLSGAYTYASCTEGKAASCQFNGRTIAHMETVTAYQNSSVPSGQQCKMETRTCVNGNLSGQYQYGSCQVGKAMSCQFNGQDIPNGGSVKAYESSTVAYGRTCVTQNRVCTNGSLSGAYAYGSCTIDGPRSCLFNGRTIGHGQTVTAFTKSQVGYGYLCSSYKVYRTCNDGMLSGDTQAIYDSCGEGTAKSCYLGGRTIANGEKIVAYANSAVAYGGTCQAESRTCMNGALTGSYENLSCAVENPHKCFINGQTLDHGASTIAYQSSHVPYGSSCQAQERRCNDGSLSGAYTEASCTVDSPKSCDWNGQSIVHGQSVTAYQSSRVAAGANCASETRTCNNGQLSGNFVAQNCQVQMPADPCGDVVAEFQARQAVTSGSRANLPALITKAVHEQSFCSDNGIDYIPVSQRTVAYVEANTRYHLCMYPGLPQWFDGGRWVGMNYFSSHGMTFSITGSYKIVRNRNMSWAPGFETVRQFASRNGLTFIQAPGESYDIDSLWVCKRPAYAPSGGGGGGNNHTQYELL